MKKNNYKIVKCPKEFSSMSARTKGMIPEHRLIAAIKYNKILCRKDIVHHIDGNKRNNNPDNLIIVTEDEHYKIHEIGNNGYARIKIKEFKNSIVCSSLEFRKIKNKNKSIMKCELCGKEYCSVSSKRRSCSAICYRALWRKEHPIEYERIKRG